MVSLLDNYSKLFKSASRSDGEFYWKSIDARGFYNTMKVEKQSPSIFSKVSAPGKGWSVVIALAFSWADLLGRYFRR
jgi:hypothetical protein